MADRFWAPWRMEYIEAPKRDICVFCDFALSPSEQYREKLILLVQPHAVLALNRYPFASCHLLVSPRRHVADLALLADDEYTAMMSLVRDAVVRLRSATHAEGINVGINLGKAAGAGIADHLHTHAVPRWAGDANFMPVIADVRILPEMLDSSWQRLRPYFADLAGQQPT